jgi:alkylated DNA repair dioxygenase AlkB
MTSDRYYCEGDTYLIENLLSSQLSTIAFNSVFNEIKWEQITQEGNPIARLVASQSIADPETGSRPIYRKPLDSPPQWTLFTPTIQAIYHELQCHPSLQKANLINHCYVQFYRDGDDYIGPHSDKTLDILHGSDIVNLTLYANDNDIDILPREMTFSSKRKNLSLSQNKISLSMPHNSAVVIGPLTNARWLHSVARMRKDQRNRRISLVFRSIATFCQEKDNGKVFLYGQGVPTNGVLIDLNDTDSQHNERKKMFIAFREENRCGTNFDWDRVYGKGIACLY